MKLKDLIEVISDIEVKRDAEFSSLGMATSKYEEEKVLSFLSNEKFLNSIIENTSIVAIVTTIEIAQSSLLPDHIGLIISNNPKETFYEIHNKLADTDFYWTKFDNNISSSAKVSEKSIIAKHSVKIGDNTIIEPGVTIHSGVIIGSDVIIRSGSQIGTSGFQFLNSGHTVLSVKTAGKTVIKNNVEIQHNCCVDRGVLGGDTIIKEHAKLDNFVHIAHDDVIGERTFITAGVKISGRVVIGTDCWVGVNSTISNGITIGDHCKITLGSVVTKDVPNNTTVSGNFAIEHKRFIDFIKSIR